MPNPILELLGQKVFFRLVQRYGGQTLRIPTHPNQDLNELLGQENARRLCFYLGGQTLYIPKLTNVLLEQRNQLIRHLRSRGLSVRELALRFDLSERQIWKILQKHHTTPSPSSKNHP